MQCPFYQHFVEFFPSMKLQNDSVAWKLGWQIVQTSNLGFISTSHFPSGMKMMCIRFTTFNKKVKKVENKPHLFSVHLFQLEALDSLHEKEKYINVRNRENEETENRQHSSVSLSMVLS